VYPFLWVALWPLVGLAVVGGNAALAVDHGRVLLQPTQQLFPQSLRSDLEAAIAAWETGAEEVTKERLGRAVKGAAKLGFLWASGGRRPGTPVGKDR
jgi:hypothetical protein